MSATDALADAVGETGDLFLRYVAGFDDSNATRQAEGLPNHLIWTLGHLSLYLHRAAELLLDREIEMSWDPEPFAFGSEPADDPDQYPPLATMLELFRSGIARLADAVREAGGGGLDRMVKWGPLGNISARDLVLRMVFHNGTHCGQIVDLRRRLGLGRVLGP
ncbi:MAG: DinB family protein [Phycisphaerales bacterium]|nr:MAG: DinB family protein [Phycisphaerales bacterium]